MKFSFDVRAEAEMDLAEAQAWYEKSRVGLGLEFLDEAEATFERIRQNPKLWPAEYRGVRRARIHRFPYIVYFNLTGHMIEVFAVIHGSRHSRVWRSRL